MTNILTIEGLTLTAGASPVVSNLSLSLASGERLGIVGESGSGKSMASRAIMDLLPPGITRKGGRIVFDGTDIPAAFPDQMRALRGAGIGLIFQEPMTSLNPALRIGRQLDEGLALHHRDLSIQQRKERIGAMLKRVGLNDPDAAMRAYPHAFSGGMRQRIMIASVMLVEPKLIIADEPTTALDAVVQRDVLELLSDLVSERQAALILISHDMALVARYTDRIHVMKDGHTVEEGSTSRLLATPAEAYTRKLLASLPTRGRTRAIQEAPPIIETAGVEVGYGPARKAKKVLHGIDLKVRPHEVVALVGGSGSGKTTLGRAIAGLTPHSAGEIRFDGAPVERSRRARVAFYARCQMVFQDPYSSLDPRIRVGAAVMEPLRHETGLSRPARRERMLETLTDVGLGPAFADRFPHQLSGGQRQRVAIARALVRRPDFVIADEAVSALDLTVQAQVLELLAKLQAERGFACLFITHDLSVVEQIADRVVVMHEGRIVEEGTRDDIFDRPQSPYTRHLLEAVPKLRIAPGGGVELAAAPRANMDTV